MKLVVTGASGFLGRELLRQALETGISVTALSSRPDRLREMFGQAEKLSSLGREALAAPAEKKKADGHSLSSEQKRS